MQRDSERSPLRERDLMVLAQALRPVVPDPRERRSLRLRIVALVWRWAVATLRAAEPRCPSWLDAGPGVSFAVLHEDRDSGVTTCLVRLAAGTRARIRSDATQVLLIAGQASAGGCRLKRGGWQPFARRTLSGIVSTRRGGLMLLRTLPVAALK